VQSNQDLVIVLRRAARDLVGRRGIRDLDQTLTDIVRAAVDTVPHVEAGGISISENGILTSRNPSNEVVTELDRRQSELGEGPCITTVDEPPADGIVVAQDLAGEDGERWPRFARLAVEAGYRAMMSTELTGQGPRRAALNLYGVRANVFDDEARMTAALFGAQAAMLLYGSEAAQDLQRAVDSRDLIGQAKGILMERFKVTDDGAFQLLVRSSQDTNMKVVDVAAWLRDEANRGGGPVPDEQAGAGRGMPG
jgi:hypothetical protein